MKLSIKDRVVLSSAIPSMGKFEDLVLREDISKKTGFTQIEIDTHKIHQVDNGSVQWDESGYISSEYEFTELEHALIKRVLVDLNNQSKLTVDHLDLYRKFVS